MYLCECVSTIKEIEVLTLKESKRTRDCSWEMLERREEGGDYEVIF